MKSKPSKNYLQTIHLISIEPLRQYVRTGRDESVRLQSREQNWKPVESRSSYCRKDRGMLARRRRTRASKMGAILNTVMLQQRAMISVAERVVQEHEKKRTNLEMKMLPHNELRAGTCTSVKKNLLFLKVDYIYHEEFNYTEASQH